MPLYDYRCVKCGLPQQAFRKIEERHQGPACPDCGTDCEKEVTGITKQGAHVFKAGYYEHIAEKPIYCGTKADLRAACREHNAGSDYAW